MKDYDRNKETLYLNCWDVNNLYGWAMSQKLPVNNLNGQKKLLNLMKVLQKTILRKVMRDIFLKLMFNTQKNM